jgi:hypothetical protein
MHLEHGFQATGINVRVILDFQEGLHGIALQSRNDVKYCWSNIGFYLQQPLCLQPLLAEQGRTTNTSCVCRELEPWTSLNPEQARNSLICLRSQKWKWRVAPDTKASGEATWGWDIRHRNWDVGMWEFPAYCSWYQIGHHMHPVTLW